jgi:small subunit ribosomal protein S20
LAHSLSAEKRARRADRRRLRNRSVRSATKTQIREVLPLIEGRHPEEAEPAVHKAVAALDKAAQKGVIHANNAARRKSRLMTKYNAAVAAAAAAPTPEEEAPPKKRARRPKKEAEPAPAPATKAKATRRPRKSKE